METGKSVVTSQNASQLNTVVTDLLESNVEEGKDMLLRLVARTRNRNEKKINGNAIETYISICYNRYAETNIEKEEDAQKDTSHKEVSLAAFISHCKDGWI